MELMPADRLPAVAARILASQPDPPRRVRLSDVWTVNWPLLLYILLPGAIINAVITFVPHLPIAIRLVVVLLPIASLLVWVVLVIAPQVAALQRGVLDGGAVVEIMLQPRGGYRGLVKLERIVRAEPSTFYYLTARQVKVGDRLRVLVDPSNGKVLTTLGVQPTLA